MAEVKLLKSEHNVFSFNVGALPVFSVHQVGHTLTVGQICSPVEAA